MKGKYWGSDKHYDFEDHVLEFYTQEDLLAEFVSMLDSTHGRSLMYGEKTKAAKAMVQGGDFLVYYGDIDDFAKETHLIDRRLGVERRWERYVYRVSGAIIGILKYMKLEWNELYKTCLDCLPKGDCMLVTGDPNGDYFMIANSPAAQYLSERASKKSCRVVGIMRDDCPWIKIYKEVPEDVEGC